MDTLPVALDGGRQTLVVDERRHPIWPVSTQLEMGLLVSTAGRVGSAVRLARAYGARQEQTESASGAVASIEPGAWSEGQLYAHLTGRRFLPLEDAERLSDAEDLEVLVCSPEALSWQLLDRLYERPRPIAPGIVYGRTPAELRSQVLRASALARLRARAEGAYIQVSPDRGGGSEEERSWIAEAIALDASVLAVLTHSDGLDAPLAKGVGRGNLLICPIRGVLDVPPHRTPECRHSGWCHRVRMQVADGFERGELVDPQAFRARVLVWSTCYGLVDRDAPLDRRWSLVDRFNLNPNIDVVLAKWRAAFGHGPLTELVQGLALGSSVGEVVAAFNAGEGVLERGTQFAILGDPRVAAPFREVHPAVETFYGSPPSIANGPADPQDARLREPGEVALLRQCMTTPLRYGDEERDAAGARERFEQAYLALERDSASAQRLAEVQNAALDCFRRYTEVVRGWSPLVVHQEFSIGASCGHCGALKTDAINTFGTLRARRRIGTCPRCQITEDSPVDLRLDFRVIGDQIELLGEIPRGLFAGIVVLWSTTALMGTVRRWPVGRDGSPLRQVALDAAWPRGTARVTVWLMFDLHFVMLNHRMTGQVHAAAQS
jgi:hypothetical protein